MQVRLSAILFCFLFITTSLIAQVCPNVLAVFPTSPELLSRTPATGVDERERFEFRECETLQVLGYERGKEKPLLNISTGESYPPYLFHLQNVLAFQALGGASDHVYVFAFQKGKPKLVLKTATKEVMGVSVDQNQHSVTILVSTVTYPNVNSNRKPAPPLTKLILALE